MMYDIVSFFYLPRDYALVDEFSFEIVGGGDFTFLFFFSI